MLPADPPDFTGREHELGQLDKYLADPGRPVVICGMAGIGKTSLAVHWGRRVGDRFPDGQLYLNLRGFDPGGQTMTVHQAVRIMLDALGVPAGRIPADPDAQVGLYRSLLVGRRVLLVLDNASDADQVRPLLPGSPTALVLVTSRTQLTSLVAIQGAHLLVLDLLSPVEARDLLAQRLGGDRVAHEPQAVDGIIDACARLPLALAIAAARASLTGFPLVAVAAELAGTDQRLDALDAGDPSSRIRAVFSWSYATLTPPAAQLFRLLGLHPGPDFGTAAAASLAGCPEPEAHRVLRELVRANLLTELAPGRYVLHDLLHIYAAELVGRIETSSLRGAAVVRLLDHYIHSAYAADRLLHPHRDPIQPPLVRRAGNTLIERFANDRQAMDWLGTEHRSLLAVQRLAVKAGHHTAAWQLAWTIDTFLIRRGYRHDLTRVWRTAFRAGRRLDEPVMRAYAHRALAVANLERGCHDDARRHAERALTQYTDVGDVPGQAHAHRTLAYLRWQQDDPRQALHHAQLALALFRSVEHHHGVAIMLNGVGWYHAELGNHPEALAHCEQALALLNQLCDDVGAAHTWDSLGYAHHHLGHYTRAIDCYHQAMALTCRLGDRHDQADTLTRLGDTYQATGNHHAARAAWQQALDILTDIQYPDTRAVRGRLGRAG